MTSPLTYTVEEASRLLGVSRGVGYEAARRGELPTIKLGRRLLVPKAALDRMLGLQDDESPAARRALAQDTAGTRRDASD